MREYASFATAFDVPVRDMLLNGDNPLVALTKIAGKYRVARTLPRSGDIERGLRRFQPVADALVASDPTEGAIHAVISLSARLKIAYGREALSAASKFLWFQRSDSVVIYDSQALTSLRRHHPGLPRADYGAYYHAWQSSFRDILPAITAACHQHGAPTNSAFTARVFDWMIWANGKQAN